jgi:nitrite reductase (NADH) small subunit
MKEQTEAEDRFIAIAQAGDVPPGGSLELDVNGQPVALFHTRDGEWIATNGRCPHEQGPLVDCILGNGRLTCPIHSYSFDVKTGACDNPDIGALKIYSIEIRDERVLIKAGP